jgi:HNH endonuclease/AP2 domain
MKNQLSQEKLKELFSYDPETGKFESNQKSGKRRKGFLHPKGYVMYGIEKKAYLAHRLAWLYVYGEMPSLYIDHINRVKNDNRISNLRLVNHAENGQNRNVSITSKSKVKGVYWNKNSKKWLAYITFQKKKRYLGGFDSLEDAKAAYGNEAARIHKYNPIATNFQKDET